MTARIRHRGPDGEGHWFDVESGIGLGHRRLSIIDLSAEGNQPMTSKSGRYVITFNGEIYNFENIRKKLPAQPWRGHSDTEVLLAGIEYWGLERATSELVGMFAFAVWDRVDRVLHLVRDRLGIKPMYYGWSNGTLVFASELKAMNAHEDFTPELSRAAIADFLQLSYIPAPGTIYSNARKLAPGTIATFSAAAAEPARILVYWSARDKMRAGYEDPWAGDEAETVEAVNRLALDSVKLRMIADVRIGAFLSGGIDSSLVVALMQSASTKPVRTFTIGFDDPAYDESAPASSIARHLGTDHTCLRVSAAETSAAIPEIADLYDEPFADASQIPTYLVSKLARQHVTVSLSGDGGDEMFGGYNRYIWLDRLSRWNSSIPRLPRRALSSLLSSISPQTWDSMSHVVGKAVGSRVRMAGMKIHKLAPLLAIEDPFEMFDRVISTWETPSDVMVGARENRDGRGWMQRLQGDLRFRSCSQALMFLDSVSYLPDDILTKLDRATMGVSLEGRVPLLDHRLVEFAWSLPLKWTIQRGKGKWILRRVLERYMPRESFERPKMGFAIPVGDWLRTSLRDWAESLLSEREIRDFGILDPHAVRAVWSDHLSGRNATDQRIWSILMLLAWFRTHAEQASQDRAVPQFA